MVFFTLNFLRLEEQWQRVEPESLPEKSSEYSWCRWWWWWQLLLWWEDEELESGGFPEKPEEDEGGWGGTNIDPIPNCFPLETLPSPVIEDKNDDEFADDEILNDAELETEVHWLGLGFVKSRVTGWWDCLTTLTGIGFSGWEIASCGCTGGWNEEEGGGGESVEFDESEERERLGARRKRAWPVRLRTEMSFLNLPTVASVTSLHSASRWGWEDEDDKSRSNCSMDFIPADAASSMATSSSIFFDL